MPDVWEDSHGFNQLDASDGPEDADGDGYTNVEEYLNGVLTIDDFEVGPIASADYPATGIGGGEPTASEQGVLDPDHVAGGVRLLSLTALAKSLMTATLAPTNESDDGLLVSVAGKGIATLTYDGMAGGTTASGSSGALNLDLSSYGAIVLDAREVTGDVVTVSLSLSDSTATVHKNLTLANGANRFTLSSFTGIDLREITQIQFNFQHYVSDTATGETFRIRDIAAVPD
jgi:hypothetical protein